MRGSTSVLLLWWGFVASAAPDPSPAVPLTLDRAVAIALDSSQRIGVADALVSEAEAGLDEARSGLRPQIGLGATASRTTSPVRVFGNKLGQERFAETDFELDRLNEPDALSNLNGALTFYQPLYAGGRLAAGVDAAEAVTGEAVAARDRTRQEVVEQVIRTYTDAVLAVSELAVAREALATSEADVALVSDLHGAGLVVESDLLQARVRQTEIRELVVRAESSVEITRAALNLALGRELGTPMLLVTELGTSAVATPPVEQLVATALDRRPDLRASERRLRAAESNLRAARAGHRPELGLSGGLETNAEDPGNAWGTNWTLLVGARIELFDGGRTRSRVKRTTARTDRARHEHELLEQIVALEVHRAYHELRAARLRLEQATTAVAMGDESLRIVRDRYGEGLTTLVELLEAETARTRARAREVGARRDLLLAGARLDLATGRP